MVETLVALAIIGLTMTLGMSLLAWQSDVARRLRAHQEATRIVESTLEGVRGGLIPLTEGRVRLPAVSIDTDGLALWLDVRHREGMAGLSDIEVEARYVVGSQVLQRKVLTMVWRSP